MTGWSAPARAPLAAAAALAVLAAAASPVAGDGGGGDGGRLGLPRAALGVPIGTGDTPMSPSTWGGANQWACHVNLTDPTPEGNKTWMFQYSYNADVPADRYDHPEGQVDQLCQVEELEPHEPCTVINRPDGNAYVMNTDGSVSCQFPVPIGPVRYDWVSASSGVYTGISDFEGTAVDTWQIQGQAVNHWEQSRDGKALPVAYWEWATFPKIHEQGLKQWEFMLDTYARASQDPAHFEVPAGCTSQCKWKHPRGAELARTALFNARH